jgi:hypothetical protein
MIMVMTSLSVKAEALSAGPIKYEYFCFTFAIGSVALNPEVQGGGWDSRRGVEA